MGALGIMSFGVCAYNFDRVPITGRYRVIFTDPETEVQIAKAWAEKKREEYQNAGQILHPKDPRRVRVEKL